MCRGSCKSSPEPENQGHLQPHHAQLRKKRNKSKKEPVWRSSTGASGLLKLTALRSEVAPAPGLSYVATPTKAIITIPITLYGYGNGDDAEEGAPERRRDGRDHGEYKRDKARRCSLPACPFIRRTASGSKSRSIRVLALDAVSSVSEYTTLSAERHIRA